MIKSNLRNILDFKNISISDLSKSTKISRKTLTALADNKSSGIKFSTLNALVSALNVPIDNILDFSTDKQISINNLKINDGSTTFTVRFINQITDTDTSFPVVANFKYLDDVFIFTSPTLDTDEKVTKQAQNAFNKMISLEEKQLTDYRSSSHTTPIIPAIYHSHFFDNPTKSEQKQLERDRQNAWRKAYKQKYANLVSPFAKKMLSEFIAKINSKNKHNLVFIIKWIFEIDDVETHFETIFSGSDLLEY